MGVGLPLRSTASFFGAMSFLDSCLARAVFLWFHTDVKYYIPVTYSNRMMVVLMSSEANIRFALVELNAEHRPGTSDSGRTVLTRAIPTTQSRPRPGHNLAQNTAILSKCRR
jgi:hypothetical protein